MVQKQASRCSRVCINSPMSVDASPSDMSGAYIHDASSYCLSDHKAFPTATNTDNKSYSRFFITIMRNKVIIISVLLNVLLFGVAAYLGIHTGYIKRNLIRIGIIAPPAKDSVLPADFWCIRGWTNTLEKMDIDADIVFFGNSITCGSTFQEYFPDKKIINLGYPGDNLDGMLYRIEMIRAVKPEKCFVMAGINDSWRTNDEIKRKYHTLLSQLKTQLPQTQFYIESILPINSSRFGKYCNNDKIIELNLMIAALAQDFDFKYIDLYSLYANETNELNLSLSPDGVHLFHDSYERWANLIRQYVYE